MTHFIKRVLLTNILVSAFNKQLSSVKMDVIKTFIFFDSETTGLPSFENNTTKITELCLVAVQADHIRLGINPRVQNKMTVCLNPNKLISYKAAEMTGLSNTLLDKQSSFSQEIGVFINNFLQINQKPICFVAHNGDRFDYPIFRAELDKVNCNLPHDILCIDSIVAFKSIEQSIIMESNDPGTSCDKSIPLEFCDGYDVLLYEAANEIEKRVTIQKVNETTPIKKKIIHPHEGEAGRLNVKKSTNFSYKLADVFTRFTLKQPINAHNAEADVNMLIMCATTLGDKFVDWANVHAKNFCDIPIMTSR